MTDQPIITSEGLEKIKKELNALKNTRRPAVIEKIATAKEQGDLSENAEYHDAKDEQGIIETRIAELEHLLKVAIVQDNSANSDCVQLGSTVIVEDASGNQKQYKIVGFNESDPSEGLISNESPFGQAFQGKCKGDTVEVEVPSGTINFRIIDLQ